MDSALYSDPLAPNYTPYNLPALLAADFEVREELRAVRRLYSSGDAFAALREARAQREGKTSTWRAVPQQVMGTVQGCKDFTSATIATLLVTHL